MDAALIAKWNAAVTPKDTVYMLGDFCPGGGRERVSALLSMLNGYKVLVMGNWDRARTPAWWWEAGFAEVSAYPIVLECPMYGTVIASHEPLARIPAPCVNIFGHVHVDPAYKTITKNAYCVSAERLAYKPVLIEDILRAIGECATRRI
jgi:calcineurin-like phosphoesterase family protein